MSHLHSVHRAPRATPAQTRYFYATLKTLASGRALPVEHPLTTCPVDPFSIGSTSVEQRAARKLHANCGNWSYDLRRLHYGFVVSGRRLASLHMGLGTLTIADDELRTLLRSHPGDERLFPHVCFPDEIAEANFRKIVRDMDERKSA